MSYFNAFLIFVVIIVCVFPLSVITLIPRENSLFYPDSWYKTAIIYVFIQSTIWSLVSGMEVTIFTGTTSRITIGMFLKFYLLIMLGSSLVCYSCFYVYKNYYGYHLPVPALFVWLNIGALVVKLIGAWIISPEELRATKEHQEKLIFFAIYQFYFVFVLPIQIQFLEYGFYSVAEISFRGYSVKAIFTFSTIIGMTNCCRAHTCKQLSNMKFLIH